MRKSTKKRLLYVTGGMLLQAILFFGCLVWSEHKSMQRYGQTVKEKEERIRKAERKVFVTKREIRPGEAFTEENTEYVSLLSEQEAGLFATTVEGYYATAELPAGRMVYETDCCERSPGGTEKECVYYDIGNVEYFEDFAVVDVRIRYGNGENYCVLRGKSLTKQTGEENGCSFCLTEEEQLLMSGATYDAETYRGTTLYLVGTKAVTQEGTENGFLPPSQTLLQLKRIGSAEAGKYEKEDALRQALEERLAGHEAQRINGVR